MKNWTIKNFREFQLKKIKLVDLSSLHYRVVIPIIQIFFSLLFLLLIKWEEKPIILVISKFSLIILIFQTFFKI